MLCCVGPGTGGCTSTGAGVVDGRYEHHCLQAQGGQQPHHQVLGEGAADLSTGKEHDNTSYQTLFKQSVTS